MRTYRKSPPSAAALLILAFPVLVSAHHSRAEYSDDVIELTGELVDVFWRNPHAGLNITLINDQGVQEDWRIETFGSPNLFGRMGVDPRIHASPP